jgi:prepilin-type N-terminal cleavage/methylation domain-containing protein
MGNKFFTINKSRGFTLLETVIAVSIFCILMFVLSSLLISIMKNPGTDLSALSSIDRARMVSSAFTNEIRSAMFGNDGSYPLSQAANSQIIFYSNVGASGSNANRIRYYVSGDTLYKGVTIPTGNPLSYNLSSETVKPILKGLVNGASPLFYYYTGDYNGDGVELSQPVNVNQAKFVKINLMVNQQSSPDGDVNFTLSAGIAIRALKNNLSN